MTVTGSGGDRKDVLDVAVIGAGFSGRRSGGSMSSAQLGLGAVQG